MRVSSARDRAAQGRPPRSGARPALKAAFNSLFFEHGYDGFGVADIAAKADVGRSTFYEHYPSKQAIFAEAVAPCSIPPCRRKCR